MSPRSHAAQPASWTCSVNCSWEKCGPFEFCDYLMDVAASTCWNHQLNRIRQIEGLRHAHQMADALSRPSLWQLARVQIWSVSENDDKYAHICIFSKIYVPRDTSSWLDDIFKATSLHYCMICFQTSRPFFARVFNPPFICKVKCHLSCCRVTPQDGDTSPSGADEPTGATGGAGALAISATSTLSLPMSQGKPSLRRIKGRIHRSKSLDSIDLLESSVRPSFDLATQAWPLAINGFNPSNGWN